MLGEHNVVDAVRVRIFGHVERGWIKIGVRHADLRTRPQIEHQGRTQSHLSSPDFLSGSRKTLRRRDDGDNRPMVDSRMNQLPVE